MARREIIIPIAVLGAPPTPFNPLAGAVPPFPSPLDPFGLPPLPPFLGGFPGFYGTGPGGGGPIGNDLSGPDANQLGGLLGNIQSPTMSMGGGQSGIGKINNIVVPTTTSVGVPFTLQFYFMNLTTSPMQFGGVLNVQGLGIDMTTLPTITVQPGQAGNISQNMNIPATQLAGTVGPYPGSFQLIHYNANGGQVVDDEQTFTIPAASSVAAVVTDPVTGMVTTMMPTMVASMPTATPDTMMAAITGATPTLPSTPGVGIVPMGTMTAMSPQWNPNDPMHMKHDRMRHMQNIANLQKRISRLQMRLMGAPMMQQMQIQNQLTKLQAELNKLQMMATPTTTTTMATDELGQTTTTTTTTSMTPPMPMNPAQNNNMDIDVRMRFGSMAPSQVGQLPINSAMNQVAGTPPAMPMVPQLPPAMNMPPWWNNQIMPMFNQQMNPFANFMGFPGGQGGWMNMQRTGSFQFMPWMNPNTGQPGTIAVPMMQMTPQTFMVPGAMLAEDIDSLPAILDGEESTPFNDELDVMMLGRNRDRERNLEVPMPSIYGCVDVPLCGDNDEWAVITAVPDGGSGLDVPNEILGYNFCPGEAIKIKWRMVIYGAYGTDGQVFAGHEVTHTDHSGRFIYHLRLPDLPDDVSAEGLVSAHGIRSHKHANTTLGIK